MRKLTKVNNDKMDSIERYHRCYEKSLCTVKYVCYCNNILCNVWQISAGSGVRQMVKKTVTVYVCSNK